MTFTVLKRNTLYDFIHVWATCQVWDTEYEISTKSRDSKGRQQIFLGLNSVRLPDHFISFRCEDNRVMMAVFSLLLHSEMALTIAANVKHLFKCIHNTAITSVFICNNNIQPVYHPARMVLCIHFRALSRYTADGGGSGMIHC